MHYTVRPDGPGIGFTVLPTFGAAIGSADRSHACFAAYEPGAAAVVVRAAGQEGVPDALVLRSGASGPAASMTLSADGRYALLTVPSLGAWGALSTARTASLDSPEGNWRVVLVDARGGRMLGSWAFAAPPGVVPGPGGGLALLAPVEHTASAARQTDAGQTVVALERVSPDVTGLRELLAALDVGGMTNLAAWIGGRLTLLGITCVAQVDPEGAQPVRILQRPWRRPAIAIERSPAGTRALVLSTAPPGVSQPAWDRPVPRGGLDWTVLDADALVLAASSRSVHRAWWDGESAVQTVTIGADGEARWATWQLPDGPEEELPARGLVPHLAPLGQGLAGFSWDTRELLLWDRRTPEPRRLPFSRCLEKRGGARSVTMP